jgi:hypothetical protein
VKLTTERKQGIPTEDSEKQNIDKCIYLDKTESGKWKQENGWYQHWASPKNVKN